MEGLPATRHREGRLSGILNGVDVVHAHDWHAGLAPAYLAARGHPAKSVFTVHNLAYQGMYYAHHMSEIDLPLSFYNMHGLEFNGRSRS